MRDLGTRRPFDANSDNMFMSIALVLAVSVMLLVRGIRGGESASLMGNVGMTCIHRVRYLLANAHLEHISTTLGGSAAALE